MQGDSSAAFARALVDARKEGVTLTSLDCGGETQPTLLAGGWTESGGWIADVSLALKGSSYVISLEVPAGVTPAPSTPPHTDFLYDNSCPAKIEGAAGLKR